MKTHEHFRVEHEFHKAASKEFATRAEACGQRDYEKMAACDENLSKLHSEHAKHFTAMHESAARKSVEDQLAKDRNRLEPTQVRGVVPTNPSVTAVPRFGSAPLQRPAVDEEFASLVKVADDRDE